VEGVVSRRFTEAEIGEVWERRKADELTPAPAYETQLTPDESESTTATDPTAD